MEPLLKLIRKHPLWAATIIALIYVALFGFKAVVYVVIAIALIIAYLIALTDDDIDDDWFNSDGPRPA